MPLRDDFASLGRSFSTPAPGPTSAVGLLPVLCDRGCWHITWPCPPSGIHGPPSLTCKQNPPHWKTQQRNFLGFNKMVKGRTYFFSKRVRLSSPRGTERAKENTLCPMLGPQPRPQETIVPTEAALVSHNPGHSARGHQEPHTCPANSREATAHTAGAHGPVLLSKSEPYFCTMGEIPGPRTTSPRQYLTVSLCGLRTY